MQAIGNKWYNVITNERDAQLKPIDNSVQFNYKEATFFLYDHLGNTRVSYSKLDNGLMVHSLTDYFPYGKILREYVSTRPRYLTTQHERDVETDLDYRGARYYDSEYGRFLSVDPEAAKAPGWSTYRYCFDNPLMYTDPTGQYEDWVEKEDGSIYWDDKANDQASTKEGEKYLGKTLTFEFVSYIDEKLWDGPMGSIPTGVKLTSDITLTASENSDGQLTDVSTDFNVKPGETPVGSPRLYYPGKGGSNNRGDTEITKSDDGVVSKFKIGFEQHACVSLIEEAGLRAMGYKIVDVAQKLNIVSNKGFLWVGSYTDIFPSASLSVNGQQIMHYAQPSFVGTHSAPPIMSTYLPGQVQGYNFDYYPSKFFKR